MYIGRIAETELNQALNSGKVVIVLGARQVGKTTLVSEFLRGSATLFLNSDVDIDKSRFLAAASLPPPDAIRFLGNPSVLVLDEAQRLPQAAQVIKGWHDSRVPIKAVLLGSSPLDLLDRSAESLTGRNRKIFLPPLLFLEALRAEEWGQSAVGFPASRHEFAAPIRSSLMRRLAHGSYPEVVLSNEPERLLRDLSSDYLWKDILQTGLVKTPDPIRRLLMLLAHQAGSEVSVQELATQLQMARPTVDRYLNLLEQTYVIFRLKAFSTNPRKEISKSQKVFFWDTGIRNALLNAHSTDEFRADIGALWENWVIAEIAKKNLLLGNVAELHFWRTRAQSEVDLIVRQGEHLRAFEIKWRARRTPHAAFRAAYGVEVELLTPEDPFVTEKLQARNEPPSAR